MAKIWHSIHDSKALLHHHHWNIHIGSIWTLTGREFEEAMICHIIHQYLITQDYLCLFTHQYSQPTEFKSPKNTAAAGIVLWSNTRYDTPQFSIRRSTFTYSTHLVHLRNTNTRPCKNMQTRQVFVTWSWKGYLSSDRVSVPNIVYYNQNIVGQSWNAKCGLADASTST